MIETLIHDSFLIRSVSLVIGVAGSWLNALDQCFGDFENHGRLIGENGEISQLLLEQV